MISISVGFIGAALCLISSYFAILSAAENKRWYWAVALGFLGPVLAFLYSLKYEDDRFACKLIVSGVAIIGVAMVLNYI